jgi:hypothetical protein
MRINTIFLILFSSVLFISCKNENSNDSTDTVKPETTFDNSFKVNLSVNLKKDDAFSLYYSEDGTLNFKAEPIWLEVKGSESTQDVTFSLPKDTYPSQIRLDFGMNKEQEDILLKAVTFEYKGIKKQIAGSDIGNYFIPDQSKCSFDASTGLIKPVVKDGVKQYPSLYPQELTLKPLLENFGKQ